MQAAAVLKAYLEQRQAAVTLCENGLQCGQYLLRELDHPVRILGVLPQMRDAVKGIEFNASL